MTEHLKNKKEYICKMDGNVFSSQEELIQHFLEKHSEEKETSSFLEETRKALTKAFPFAEIKLKEVKSEYGQVYINMAWGEVKGECSFYLGKKEKKTYNAQQFENVEEAISYYQRFLDDKEEIVQKLENNYSIKNLSVLRMEDGINDDERKMVFKVKIDENQKEKHCTYFLAEGTEKFIHGFKAFYDTCFEGEVTKEIDQYRQYEVDGIKLEDILKRAKRIKLEILEEKPSHEIW